MRRTRRPSRIRPGIAPTIVCLLLVGAALAPAALAEEAQGGRPDAEAPQALEANLQRLEGGIQRLSDFRGERLLLELWATWCLPCKEQSKVVSGLNKELDSYGIKVLAVNVGQGPRLVLDHLSREPSPHSVLLDRGEQISLKLGLTGLPALVLVERDGTVAGVQTGLVPREEMEVWLRETFGKEPKDSAE